MKIEFYQHPNNSSAFVLYAGGKFIGSAFNYHPGEIGDLEEVRLAQQTCQ